MARAFLEQLPSASGELRWLTRTDEGRAEVVWAFEVERIWSSAIDGVDDAVTPWLGFSHPRVSPVLARVLREPNRIAFAVGDDRGPTLLDAAAALADPGERERWAVAQVIALADALAGMARHQPGYVHGQLEPQHVFVDPGGHARLRAPLVSRAGPAHVLGSLRDAQPTPANDAFALVAQLACALTGAPPFQRVARGETVFLTQRDPPRTVTTLTPGLDGVLARAFAKPPDARYPDPAALAAALAACLPDAADYDAVLSDRVAEWWPSAEQVAWTPPPRFPLRTCRMRWDELAPGGGSDDIRRCATCRQSVVHERSRSRVVALRGRKPFRF